MKRFLRFVAVLLVTFGVIYWAWAGERYAGITQVVVRTATATASTRTTGTLELWDNQPSLKSILGDIIFSGGIESTGTSKLESTTVRLYTMKGLRAFAVDSLIADIDTLPDTLHIAHIGTDTSYGQEWYITYTITDTYNTVNNVPITWTIKYDLMAR